ncbi:unnamed protein product [Amaranthus hypochondriacus]
MLMSADLCVRGFGISRFGSSSSSDQSTFLKNSFLFPNSNRFSLRFIDPHKIRKSACISCDNHSHGNFDSKSHRHQSEDDYLEASLLISETVRHHHLRKQGFQGEVKDLFGRFLPVSSQMKDRRYEVNSIGLGILRQFRHPTIFLKISCEGDFLLPIVVGELAIERLIDSLSEDNDGDYSNDFQLLRNVVFGLGNEVRMVKITKRVVNTYFARIHVDKVEERGDFSVDARPSDAIIVAQRCKAPIYVNKQIVLMDAIKIAYGTGRLRDTKPIYDVVLDSPMDGPDFLVQELTLIQSMKLAVEEERYNDAAMLRNELTKLRNSEIQNSLPTNWQEASTPGLL